MFAYEAGKQISVHMDATAESIEEVIDCIRRDGGSLNGTSWIPIESIAAIIEQP
jgi:hypothetical protein